MRLGQQVVDQRVDLRPVRRDRGPVTPRLHQIEQQIRGDDVGARQVQLLGREVPGGGRAELVRGHAADVPRGLGRAEVRAVGERRQDVAQQRRGELRIRARGRAEAPPPLKPVRGPREDLEQRPLGHPLLDGLLKGKLARSWFSCAAALQRRLARGRVDHEIRVLGVAGVDRGGLVRELRPELVGERARRPGQANLGAELAEQPLALRPREELRGPVRVGLRPADRDVTTAKLRREIREHARLEMTAVQLTRPVTRGDDPLPLLRGERQVDEHRVTIGRDQVARQMRVSEGVLDRVEDAAIGARRLQLDGPHEREHRRPVTPAMPRDQRHVVVRVMRRDSLDVGELRLEPARPLDRPPRQAQRDGRVWLLDGSRVKAGEDAAVLGDQALGDLGLALVDLGKLILRVLRDLRHPLAEHLRQIVAGPRPCDVKPRQQRDPLQRGDVAHHASVGRERLAREVGDLRLRDPLQPPAGVAERVNPPQILDLLTKPRPRRPPRGLLEPVERRLAKLADRLALRLHVPCLAPRRCPRRQLEAAPKMLHDLDRDVLGPREVPQPPETRERDDQRQRVSLERACAVAHDTSSSDGLIEASSRVVIKRRNRG